MLQLIFWTNLSPSLYSHSPLYSMSYHRRFHLNPPTLSSFISTTAHRLGLSTTPSCTTRRRRTIETSFLDEASHDITERFEGQYRGKWHRAISPHVAALIAVHIAQAASWVIPETTRTGFLSNAPQYRSPCIILSHVVRFLDPSLAICILY